MEIICPKPPALNVIPDQDCPFRLDQLVRMAFGRRAVPKFATDAAIKLEASWTPLLSADDETKVVFSPLFAGLVIPQSEGVFTGGGDNTTFNGLRQYQGEAFITVTGVFSNISPAVREALDAMSQFSLPSSVGVTDLGIIPFNKDNNGFAKSLGFMPIYNWRVSDRASEGLNANDTVAFSFDFLPGWDKGVTSFKPVFDALSISSGGLA